MNIPANMDTLLMATVLVLSQWAAPLLIIAVIGVMWWDIKRQIKKLKKEK